MATNAGQFSKSVVTTAGKEMIVQAQNGHTLTFTRVALGDGTLAEGEDMLALTAIKSEKLSANISSFLDKGNGQFQLKFNVNNTTLDTGFWHREIGVMAKIDDGEEELYAYSYAGAAANFLYDKTTPAQERFVNIDVLIGSATDVTVVIDGSVIYPTRAETEAMIQTHNDDAESHKDVYGRFIRQRQTDYELKDVVYLPSLGAKLYLECTTPGTTDSGDLVITSPNVGGTVTDGTVVWTIRKVADTTDATTTTHGLMSASDKTKLNGIEANANNYSLPTASASVKGGIKVGSGLSMSGDTLNNAYSLPTASTSVKGGIKVGNGLSMSGETLNAIAGFNHREVITTSKNWTAPTSGYYKVTCIGGGGAGGNGGSASLGGGGGGKGGTTSFSTISAVGGHGGGGGYAYCGGGGGAAGAVSIGFIRLSASNSISVVVGAGGAHSRSNSTTAAGLNGSGGAAGGTATNQHGGQGAMSAYGSGNSGSAYSNCGSMGRSEPTGSGGSNGYLYGGGGGGGCYSEGTATNITAPGSNGGGGAIGVNNATGGDGGKGAVIIEYFLAN